jgi:hypothetical protein
MALGALTSGFAAHAPESHARSEPSPDRPRAWPSTHGAQPTQAKGKSHEYDSDTSARHDRPTAYWTEADEGRCVRDLWDHGRPGEGDDVQLALPSGERGPLNCPIVGVAVSDWSVQDLRGHARSAIEHCGEHIDEQVFDRLAARLS